MPTPPNTAAAASQREASLRLNLSATRPCPICPNSSGVLGKSGCPACGKSGKVKVAVGDRLALTFMLVRSEHEREVVGHGDGKLRVYSVTVTPPPLTGDKIPTNVPVDYITAFTQQHHTFEGKLWAHSTERAMTIVRDAALWDGVPRPFTVTVSRSFLIEDEVIQKTRDTTAGEG